MSEKTMEDLHYVENFGLGGDQRGEPGGGAPKFYGKYRGTVLNNVDPKRLGRLLVRVTDVLGMFSSSWALPCLPMAGMQTGFFITPPINSGVWVEFEQGDARKPIWVGCWYGSPAEPPSSSQMATPGSPVTIIESMTSKSVVIISDVPVGMMTGPGILIRSGASSIYIGPTGVEIKGPTLKVTAQTDFNEKALTIT